MNLIKNAIKNSIVIFSPFKRNKLTTSQKLKLYDKYYITLYVNKKDHKEILKLFTHAYIPNEPCFMSAGLGNKHNPWFEEIVKQELTQGFSLMSVCKDTGKIVGAAINTKKTLYTASNQLQHANRCECKNTAELIRFYTYIHDAPCLYHVCNVPVIFETDFLITSPDERGDSWIGLSLIKASQNLCKDLNFPIYRVDCTSEYTARLCKSLNFYKMWEMSYRAVRRPDGKPIYTPPKPHSSIKVYIDYTKAMN